MDIRKVLSGPIAPAGVIFGPTGQITARFGARMQGRWPGFRGLPGAIGYGASKAALMHLGENLRVDLRGTGLRVQVANPGFIATRLTAKNSFRMTQLMTPETAAGHVLRLMRSKRFSASFPAPFAWLFTLGRYLPLRLFQRLL